MEVSFCEKRIFHFTYLYRIEVDFFAGEVTDFRNLEGRRKSLKKALYFQTKIFEISAGYRTTRSVSGCLCTASLGRYV